jgi:hypothetical protein
MLRTGKLFIVLTVIGLLAATYAHAQTAHIFPGIDFQLQHKGYWLYDFYPYLAYNVTDRVTAGAGWNERAGYNPSLERFIETQRVYGPRIFSDVYLGKGFYAHAESEWLSKMIMPNITNDFQRRHREWVWSLQTGVKRKFRINNIFNGTAILQYNLVNRYFATPYIDRVNFRIGVEYGI